MPLGRLVPLAVEPYGRWGDEALRLLKAAAARTVTRTAALGNPGDTAVPAVPGSWMARLSVALQRGNAECARAATAEVPPEPAEAPDLEAAVADLLARLKRRPTPPAPSARSFLPPPHSPHPPSFPSRSSLLLPSLLPHVLVCVSRCV